MEKVQDDAMNWRSLLMDGTVPYTAAIQSLNVSSSEVVKDCMDRMWR